MIQHKTSLTHKKLLILIKSNIMRFKQMHPSKIKPEYLTIFFIFDRFDLRKNQIIELTQEKFNTHE